MMIQSKIKSFSFPQHFLHCKSMGKIFDTQGHVTLKQIIRSGPKWNSSKILCLSSLSAGLKKIQSKLKVLCVHNIFSSAQGQVTSKSIDRCGQNSTSSEILWLSSLPACLMKIQSKLRPLLHPHFLHYKSIGNIFTLKGKSLQNE